MEEGSVKMEAVNLNIDHGVSDFTIFDIRYSVYKPEKSRGAKGREW
jgi:hypothetical protein